MTVSVLDSEVCKISVCSLRVESIYSEPSGSPKSNTHWHSKTSLEACLSESVLLGWGAQNACFFKRNSTTVVTQTFLGCPFRDEIKRHLLLGRKVMNNLDSIFKSRDITLPTKVRLVKAMVFPLVMYGCESWTVKKAERQRIDAFKLWCWRRLLRVPWAARRSNQSILKEISPGCSLEGMLLKLKLQYFGHLMRRVDSLEKTLMLGGIGGRGRRGRQRMAGWHH